MELADDEARKTVKNFLSGGDAKVLNPAGAHNDEVTLVLRSASSLLQRLLRRVSQVPSCPHPQAS